MYHEKNVTLKRAAKDNCLSYVNKRESVLRWLSFSKCLIIKDDYQDIMFVFNGVLYMIHLKKHLTNISYKLQHKMDMYTNYGIVTKAIYNVFELENILLDTTGIE